MKRFALSVLFMGMIFFLSSVGWAGDENKTPPKTFHGVPCSKDCGGHIAGYEWAKKKQARTVEDCRGRSKSFVE
jgi:hypothetical protein